MGERGDAGGGKNFYGNNLLSFPEESIHSGEERGGVWGIVLISSVEGEAPIHLIGGGALLLLRALEGELGVEKNKGRRGGTRLIIAKEVFKGSDLNRPFDTKKTGLTGRNGEKI